jgi:hypothetical protein
MVYGITLALAGASTEYCHTRYMHSGTNGWMASTVKRYRFNSVTDFERMASVWCDAYPRRRSITNSR